MLSTRISLWRTFVLRTALALVVFLPLSFLDIIVGRIRPTEFLGPLLISLFVSVCFSFLWLLVYMILNLLRKLFGMIKYQNLSNFHMFAEFVSLYALIGFAFLFYFYGVESPGNGLSYGVSEGQLLRNGVLTELGLRDAIKNISGFILMSCLIQFLNVIFLISKRDFTE
jgi:hypothetical protein